jgi:hypothetical protein
MKHEIKFRGKKVQMRGSMDTSEAGEFVFGSYVWDGYEHFIITDENIEWCVDPETVGQYTDYYGLEFYDGSIISVACDCDSEYGCTHPDGKYLVVWDEDTAGYALKSIRNGRLHPLDEYGVENMQVIGDRWDNPDLLEGEKI